MRWCSRLRCLPLERPRTPIIRTARSATHSPSARTGWVRFTFGISYLHGTAERNQYLGFALAFPFSSTSKTISGFETYGDNQFVTPITAFPVVRNQEKYQFRYDVSGSVGRHAPKFGVDFIHEPVLSGAFPGQAETTYVLTENPTFYLTNPGQLTAELNCLPPFDGTNCQTTGTPAGNGSFSQNVQRLGLYAMDAWRVTPQLTINYGLRWDTTYGLFQASGVSQLFNPGVQTIRGLELPLPTGVPHDYRKAFAPRLGIAYSPDNVEDLVIRAGIGTLLRRPGAERLGDCVPGSEHSIGVSTLHPAWRSGLSAGRSQRRRRSSDRSQLPHAVRAPCHRRCAVSVA